MKFQIRSANYFCVFPEILKEYLKKYCIVEDNIFYMNNPSFETIQEMINNIPDYSTSYMWKPTEVLIDFDIQTITLVDYYLE